MSSRTQRFLPTKIQRNRHAPRTKPEQFDEVIREAFDFSRKISRKSAFDKEADYFIRETYQGHIEKRRKAALRRSLNEILQRKAPTDMKEAAASDHKQVQLTFEDIDNSEHRQIQQAPAHTATPNHRQFQLDPEEAAIAWIELNAPMASYTKMEQQSHVLFATAIWMLDKITEQENWRRKLFRLLPRNEHEIEEFHEPDVWDCSYDYDLIASVVNVLYYRNLNVDRKQPIDASTIDNFEKRLDLYEDNPYALTSEYAATHQLPDDWRTVSYNVPSSTTYNDDNRERFRALLALIPQEEIDDIVDQFKALLGEWVNRFYEGLAAISKECEPLDQQKSQIAEEHNALVDELEVLIDAFEDKKRSRTVKKNDKGKGNKQGTDSLLLGTPAVNPLLVNPKMSSAKQNPLLVNAMTGSLPGIEEFIKSQSNGAAGQPIRTTGSVSGMKTGMKPANRYGFSPSALSPFGEGISGDNELDAQMDQIEGLYRRIENLEDRFNELQDETNAVFKRERSYSFQMSVYGRISNVFIESHEGLPSSLSEPMRLPDVYGLCFALLYLIEIGDDIPWLYGACYGFMMEVCESLPWGMKEYDELDDPIWEYDNDEASVPKTAAIPDLNERKYSYKDSDYYFPRSLAQILYEETGCILPRDVNIYYPEYDTFRQYGIKGKDAGFMMLMSAALSTARRNIHATNLDPEAIRFLERDPFDPLYSDEDADEDAEGDAGEERDEEDAETVLDEEPARPKDEKDILIDQLKKELKKSRAALHSAEVESRNTRKELSSTMSIYEREHRELADLREIVFNAQFTDGSSEAEQPATVSDATYPYETAKRTTVFGGHDTFLKAIKPMLPNVRFIDSSYMTFSPELVRNSDIVWVQTNCISHPMFWNVVKYAKQYGVQLRYFGYASAEKCADQVVEADKR